MEKSIWRAEEALMTKMTTVESSGGGGSNRSLPFTRAGGHRESYACRRQARDRRSFYTIH